MVDAERRGESVRFHAPRAIVTLPLSVLQLPAASPHSVRFTPELSSKRSALSAPGVRAGIQGRDALASLLGRPARRPLP